MVLKSQVCIFELKLYPKMKYSIAFLLSTIIFLSACKVEQGREKETLKKEEKQVQKEEQIPQTFDTKQYFEDVQKVNNCMGEGDSFISLGSRLDEGIKAPLKNISSAKILKDLYYEAYQRQIAAGPKTDVRCSDVNYVVKDRVLQRLSEIANEEAVDVLIDIYKDESLSLIYNDASGLAKAMSKCGQLMLTKLEPIKNLRAEIGTKVVSSIKNGKPLY
jgi:hypothetical protein